LKKYIPNLLIGFSGLAIAIAVITHINATHPIVGYDFKYFFSRLIDTHLHYRINGMSIQWYSPSFGGGLPAYPHPLNAQFSMPQLLALFIEPWQAVLLAIALYILIGYAGVYVFLRHSLGLRWMASCLGAVIFSANGFYLQHTASGHLNFQAFPVLPLFLVALFDPRLSIRQAAALMSLTVGLLVYSASIYPAVFILLSLLVTLPLAWMIKPTLFNWPKLVRMISLGGVLSLGLVASKIYAVAAFMRFFPRDMPTTPDIPLHLAPVGLVLQFLGIMSLGPYYAITGEKMGAIRNLLQANTGTYAGLWELDLSLTPITWILLLGGILTLAFSLRFQTLQQISLREYLIAMSLFLFAVWLTLEFTFARGIFYPTLRELPFLRAMHVSVRYGIAFLFPITLFSAFTFHTWIYHRPEKFSLALFLAFDLLAIAGLGAYFLLPIQQLQPRTFFIGGLQDVYQKIEQGETFPITQIADINDQRTFDDRASNMRPFETLFGYNLGQFRPDLVEGPVKEIRENAFNMTHPASLVYPEINDLQAWERISQNHSAQLDDFLNRRQPNWSVPFSQKAANLVSLMAFFLLILLLLPARLTTTARLAKRPYPTR
jgi:hypothetical protein